MWLKIGIVMCLIVTNPETDDAAFFSFATRQGEQKQRADRGDSYGTSEV